MLLMLACMSRGKVAVISDQKIAARGYERDCLHTTRAAALALAPP